MSEQEKKAETTYNVEIKSWNEKENDQNFKSFSDIRLTPKERWNLFCRMDTPKRNMMKPEFFFWNPPGRSSYEKRLVFKLDWIILAYCCLSFFIRYLDQSNVKNAYISGMKEDLHMHGSMYNWLNQCFYICYGVFSIFTTLLITKFSPHIILPIFEVLWGLMCLLVITCKNYPSIMVVRGIQGALESISYPAIQYILGSWYTSSELSARTAIFVASGSAGGMFGGYIQTGVHSSLDGKCGMPGWKWMFVIDFIITIPIAVLGYFLLPGSPEKPRHSLFLSPKDYEYCKRRMQVVKNVESINTFNYSIFKRSLYSWQFYIFGLGYVLSQLVEESVNYWGIVLEDQGYNLSDRNNFPTIQSAVKVVSCVIFGLYSDLRGKRWDTYLIICFLWISGLSILVKYDVPRAAQFYANCILGVCAPFSVVILSWANEMCKEDNQLRAFVLGSVNFLFQIVDTPYLIIVWDTSNAPRYSLGMCLSLVFCCFLVLFCGLVVMFDRYQNRIRDLFDSISNSYETKEELSFEGNDYEKPNVNS